MFKCPNCHRVAQQDFTPDQLREGVATGEWQQLYCHNCGEIWKEPLSAEARSNAELILRGGHPLSPHNLTR